MSTKTVLSKVFVLLLSVAFVAGFSANTEAATIKVGALNDMTGATSDVGKDYALGIAEAIHYVNDNGGLDRVEMDGVFDLEVIVKRFIEEMEE